MAVDGSAEAIVGLYPIEAVVKITRHIEEEYDTSKWQETTTQTKTVILKNLPTSSNFQTIHKPTLGIGYDSDKTLHFISNDFIFIKLPPFL